MANRIVGRVLIGAVGALGLLALPATLSAQTAAVPTFTKDVAPIFQNKCESCHRPDSIAPMSLQTYEEARPWARSIRDRVASRNMPPWHIDPSVGIQHYKNDRSLSQKEIDTIVKWAGNGAPKGDPKDMPAPIKWADGNGWNYADEVRRTAGHRRQVAEVHAEGRRDGRVVQARRRRAADRAPLGSRHRDAPGHDQGPQDHASRARVPDAGREGSGRVRPDQRRQRQRRRPLHGMGRQQGRRDDAPQHRQAADAGREDPLGHPLQRRR